MPADQDVLPWHRPCLGDEEIAEVVDTLRSGWLTTGPKAARFEAMMCDYLAVEAALAASSCTAALHLALLAGGISPGDEVVTPSLTFCAAVNVIAHIGATPVFVDVDPVTLNMDPQAARDAITRRTRAVIVMHYGGQPCEMSSLVAVANAHDLLLIEDAAHALGAAYQGRRAGSFGDLAALSFYANKNLTTGEGGMLVGRRDLVERARRLGRHGIDRPAWERNGARSHEGYDVTAAGLKYNMSDILASIGIPQLRKLPRMNARRAAIAQRYAQAFAEQPGIVLPRAGVDVDHAWHLYQVQVEPEVAGFTRDSLAQRLSGEGIRTAIHFEPVHRLTRYRDVPLRAPLPHTEAAGQRLLSLPCHPAMTDADVERVVRAVTAAARGSVAREDLVSRIGHIT